MRSARRWANTRPSRLVLPPGAAAITSRTGRLGYGCACAQAKATSKANSATVRTATSSGGKSSAASRRAGSLLCGFALAQLETLDLARGGLRQLVDELDRAWILVRCEAVLDERFELLIGRARALLDDDERLGLGKPILVSDADHRRFEHGRMLHERRFHLERADPDARDLQHVVAAAGVRIRTIGIANVLVAGLGPPALESFARLGAITPIHHRGGGTLDEELPSLAVGHGPPVFAAQFDFIAGNRPSGRAVAHLVAPVREEDVQHLRRADAVDDVDAEVR